MEAKVYSKAIRLSIKSDHNAHMVFLYGRGVETLESSYSNVNRAPDRLRMGMYELLSEYHQQAHHQEAKRG